MLCMRCGQEALGGEALCWYHDPPEPDWAENNRIWCDFIHRGITRAPEEPERRRPRCARCQDGAGGLGLCFWHHYI